MTGSSSSRRAKYIQEQKWFCAWCNFGPLDWVYDSSCVECGRERDQNCRIEFRTRQQRIQNLASIGERVSLSEKPDKISPAPDVSGDAAPVRAQREAFRPEIQYPDEREAPVTKDAVASFAPSVLSSHTSLSSSGQTPLLFSPSVSTNLTAPTEEDPKDGTPYSSAISDTGTRYTSRHEHPHSAALIHELAEHLNKEAKLFGGDENVHNRIAAALPSLVRALALRFGHRPRNKHELNVAVFLRRNRERIAASFRLNSEERESGGAQHDPELEKLRTQWMEKWRAQEKSSDRDYVERPNFPEDGDFLKEMEEISDDALEEDDTEIAKYRKIIIESAEYQWLIADMRRLGTLTTGTPEDLMEEVRSKISAALPHSLRNLLVSEHSQMPGLQVAFDIPWDPWDFWKNEYSNKDITFSLEYAVTITGSAQDAQAATIREYMTQTWPVTAGHTMRLVKDLVGGSQSTRRASAQLPDRTSISAFMESGRLLVSANGPEDTVIEIGQQFIWLAAALRPSPYDNNIALCLPIIREAELQPQSSYEIGVDFSFEPLGISSQAKGRKPGFCWLDMFRNPVVVGGFPTLTKPHHGLGLELSLGFMASLAGSELLSEFDGRSYIKGYSVMFIATASLGDVLVWHYLYNAGGKRISYIDHSLQSRHHISIHQVNTSRHVVGWCSECTIHAGKQYSTDHTLKAPTQTKNVTNQDEVELEGNCVYGMLITFLGTADVAYDSIRPSEAPDPHSGMMLDRISLSFGHFGVSGTASMALAQRHRAKHYTPEDYMGMLMWVREVYFVMWDEEDKIGWLVNGTTAVLHLARARLHSFARDREFSDSVDMKPHHLQDEGPKHSPISASKTLQKKENRVLKMWVGSYKEVAKTKKDMPTSGNPEAQAETTREFEETSFLFENFVKELVKKIEIAFDHQQDKAGHNGINLKRHPRQHLEGWDFSEFLRGSEISPRQAKLEFGGWGWVNFTRSIGAITLMGKGFGQLIQPARCDGVCEEWQSVKTGRYYMAASVYDLKEVARGNASKLSDLLWHSPENPLAECPCRSQDRWPGNPLARTSKQRHHNPVQTFWPQKLPRCIKEAQKPSYLEPNHSDHGAVIFANIRVPWFIWRNRPEDDSEIGSHEISPMLQLGPLENSTDESSDTRISQTSDTQTVGPSETPSTSLMSQAWSPENANDDGTLPDSSKPHLDTLGEGRTSNLTENQSHRNPMENTAIPKTKIEKLKGFLNISQMLRKFKR